MIKAVCLFFQNLCIYILIKVYFQIAWFGSQFLDCLVKPILPSFSFTFEAKHNQSGLNLHQID